MKGCVIAVALLCAVGCDLPELWSETARRQGLVIEALQCENERLKEDNEELRGLFVGLAGSLDEYRMTKDPHVVADAFRTILVAAKAREDADGGGL